MEKIHFKPGDFVIFRKYHGVIVSTEELIHPKNGIYYEHVLDVKGCQVLCYNYSLTYDLNRIRYEKIKKLEAPNNFKYYNYIIKNNPNKMVKYYEIDWSKVKTIKDIKLILAILATKVIIDHDDETDVKIYEEISGMLVETENND